MNSQFYYMFSNEQMKEIHEGNGLSVYSSIYADGKIEEPKYDYKTNKFVVRYHTIKKNKIVWAQQYFDSRSEALNFHLRKYQEYMYEWTLMFYDDFKRNSFYVKKR